MSQDMARNRPWKRSGAERQAFADRAVAHRMHALGDALAISGFTKFEVALAMLHYSVDELMFVGRDPEVLDDALREARELAQIVGE